MNIANIYNGARRRLARLAKYHPSSAPFLSGDTFRALATHILDGDVAFRPDQVRPRDTIFVASPFFDYFFEQVLPQITSSFVLISHNGDRNITATDVANLDPRILHWYAQNCLVSHPQVTPLPIGIENQRLYHHGQVRHFTQLRSQTLPNKKPAILYKFSTGTNPPVRTAALMALTQLPTAETYTDWRSPYTYLKTLQQYMFVASPAGNGEDCHRTWEAMYLGTIPIVTRSTMTEYWARLGLPLYLINSWDEISTVTEEHLIQTYARLANGFSEPALWNNYWLPTITTSN